MNKALKLFTEGDTMEATIVEAFEAMEEAFVEPGEDANYYITVSTSRDAAEEAVAGLGDSNRPPRRTRPITREYKQKIQKHLDYMFSDFEPVVSLRVMGLDMVIQIILDGDGDIGADAAAEGLADYFAFLYEGYADVYEE